MSLGDVFKRIFHGGANPDDESAEQEEYRAGDPGVAELRHHDADPLGGGGDLNAVAHELENDYKPRDPNP